MQPAVIVDHAEGNDISDHRSAAADKCVPAHTSKLMDGGVAAENDEILNHRVSTERRIVAHHHAVADDTVVPDMASRHEEPFIADDRLLPPGHRAEMEGDTLADDVVGADAQPRIFPLELEILRWMSQRLSGIDDSPGSDAGVSGNGHMTHQANALVQSYLRAERAERADHDAIGNLGARLKDR